MNYFEFAFSFFLILIQLLIINYIFGIVSVAKKSNSTFRFIIVFSCAMIYALINKFLMNFYANLTIILMSIVFNSLFYETDFWKKLVIGAICVFAITAIDFIMAIIIKVLFFAEIEYYYILFLSYSIFLYLIFYGVLKFISDYKFIVSFKIIWQTIIALIILPIISLLIVGILTHHAIEVTSGFNDFILPMETAMLLLINLVVLLVYNYINVLKTQENFNRKKFEIIEREKEFYYDLTQKYVISNKTMHDLKNRLYAIENMIDSQNDNAREEIQRICDIVKKAECKIFTGNIAIDMLINAKIKIADEKSICINVKSIIAKINEYDITDICALLGNILDNAIAATEEVIENRNIDLSIMQVQENICISAVNPVAQLVNSYISQSDSLLHGYGLKNVREIVRKYGGDCKYGIENSYFVIRILI